VGAAADARGLKRICTSCGTRFYDLKKRPINCPNCKEEFTGETKIKTRRGRAALIEKEVEAKPIPAAANDETEIKADDEVVSLEDIKDAEDAGDEDEDIGLGDAVIEDLEEIDEDELEEELEVEVEKTKDD
jgi:uncharacterized protein (TIGR02300 family)